MTQLLSWRRILIVAMACGLAACSDGSGNGPNTSGGSSSAPTISGSPMTGASVGIPYSFQPTASDPNGDALTFSVTNSPSWASFDPATGRLSGTPTSSMAGLTFRNIVIQVSDGSNSASLPAFAIAVSTANGAPTISGTPATAVNVGQAYSFRPTASDPESQALTFSISGRPSWAIFDSATGALTGTPTAAATHSSIVIRVTDGTNTVPLPTFSITVSAAGTATGTATLRWTPPTLNEDGTPIENLAGYRVYYGTSTSNLNQVLTIANPAVTSAVIENLYTATWYFALKAYNASNVESSFSNIASKTIR